MVVVIAVVVAAMAAMPAKVDIVAWTLLEERHGFETTDKVNIPYISTCQRVRPIFAPPQSGGRVAE